MPMPTRREAERIPGMSHPSKNAAGRILAAACCTLAAVGGCLSAGEPKAGAKEPTTNKEGAPAMSGIEILDESFRQVVRKDSAVRRICDQLQFTEGPVWIAGSKSLLFSDISADTIYRWTLADGKTAFRRPSHNANGNTVDAKGRLVTCEHGSRVVTRTEASGQVVTIASSYQGRKLNSPNDVVVKSDGTIWFTDPPYGVARGLIEQKANHVFRLGRPGDEPVSVASDFDMPNGLCFSPDEKYLYVADSGRPHHIRCLAVGEGNVLGKGEVFAVVTPGVPDGIRVDASGRLYSAAGDGIQVFDTKGKLIGKMRTPPAASNCCFGGAENKTLFITARDGVFAVALSVAGAR
jgi:gluconolactonase